MRTRLEAMASLSRAGREVDYLDVGTGGPPVVLLHAFPLNSQMWAPQIACLAATRRVIAVDLVGFGGSSPAEDPMDTRIADLSDDVAALVESLDIAPVVAGGLSMGGYVAFDLWRRHPGMIAGLVLADTRAAADTAEAAARRSGQQEQIEQGGTEAVIDTLLAGLLGDTTRSQRPALVAQVRALMASAPPAAYVGALEAMKHRPDSTGDLAQIRVPTLVLVGEEDQLSPPDSIRQWQPLIPRSELVVLPGAGHVSNLEAPDEFNAAVVDFLDGL